MADSLLVVTVMPKATILYFNTFVKRLESLKSTFRIGITTECCLLEAGLYTTFNILN